MVRPSPDSGRSGAVRRTLFEGALLGSGRPVLLTPQDWGDRPIGSKVVIAWRDRREATRALADASPFLDMARDILVVRIEEAHADKDEVGPEDVARHLVRRGLRAHAAHRDGANVGEAVLAMCAGVGADLLVMGGYGRPVWRETVLGGVTQSVLTTARLPVLMSH
jgi:nucleotide-binding universal stress UspA family protein